MPLTLGHRWWQRDGHVHVTVTVPGTVTIQRADVFTSGRLLQITKPPVHWELLLCHRIDEAASQCTVLPDAVVFRLAKVDPSVEWMSLECEVARGDRAAVKEQLLREHHERLAEERKRNAVERDSKRKEAIHRQIEREAEIRQAAEQVLEKSKERALRRMSVPLTIDRKAEPIPVPDIRRAATLEVTFSQRNFVTPMRESTEQAEKEWIRKQAATRRAIGFVEDDLRPDERNPEWLLHKGNAFAGQRNYLAALAAYGTGIRLNGSNCELLLARAATHEALGNHQRCAEDCSAALELLEPPVDANRAQRIDALMRRANALDAMGFRREASTEMAAAARLDPTDGALRDRAQQLLLSLEE